MTLTDQALEYGRTHLQGVRICWLDGDITVCGAVEAVTLCSDCGVAGIVGVVAQDRKLDSMLHQLIDGQ